MVTKISVDTESCQGCETGLVEQGLVLHLLGAYTAQCTTASLDDPAQPDYTEHHMAQFHSTETASSPDHGLGECNNVSIKAMDWTHEVS